MPNARSLPPIAQGDLDHAHAVVGERWEALRAARLFVTGGTGFVGKWLVATLLDADRRLDLRTRITLLSRDPAAFESSVPELACAANVDLLQGDVRDFAFPQGRFSHVVHAATDVTMGATPLQTFDTCVLGTRRVLDFAVHTGALDVLLVSSGAVYGPQPAGTSALREDFAGGSAQADVGSAYGEGKRAAEWLAAAYGQAHALRIRTARCFAFVGPYLPLDGRFAVGNFLADATQGRRIVLSGDGTPRRSYLHACDLAAWLWSILASAPAGATYNVGGAEAVTIRELARRALAAAGRLDLDIAIGAAKGGADYVPDVTKARRELCLAEPISLNESLRRTADWLVQQSRATGSKAQDAASAAKVR